MFSLYNKPGHKFANKKFYSIAGVLNAYEKYLDTKEPVMYQGYVFNRANSYLTWILHLYKNDPKLKCSCCGCKANHFRLINETQGIKVLHLFGIKHIKGTKSAEYLFFNRDHICPQSAGGYSGRDNIRLTCEKCNAERGNSTKNMKKTEIKAMQQKSEVIRIANKIAAIVGKCKKALSANSKDRHLLNKLIEYIWTDKNNITTLLANEQEDK